MDNQGSLKLNEISVGTQTKNATKRHSVFVVLATAFIVTIAQLSGNTALICAAMFLYVFVMFTAKESDLFPFFLFFLPWSPILKISPSSVSFASVVTIVVFLKYLFIKKQRIDARLIFIVSLIFSFTLLIKILQGYDVSLSYLMLIFMFLAFPYIFDCVSEKTSFSKSVRFFSLGIITAAVISKVFSSNPYLIRYIKVFFQEDIYVTRLCGFYGDPNFYSAQIVAAFGGMLVVMNGKDKSLLIDLFLLIMLTVVGLISVSKSYILCTVFVLLLWLLASLRKPLKVITVAFAVVIVGMIILWSGVCDDIIAEYLARFKTSTDAAGLTTGRSKIWQNYLAFLYENPLSLFFGQGCTPGAVVVKSSHNTLIQLLYQFGVVGCGILFFWFRYIFTKNSVIKVGKRKEFMFSLMWVSACFIMWMGLDLLFFDDFLLIILLCVLGRNYLKENDLRGIIE